MSNLLIKLTYRKKFLIAERTLQVSTLSLPFFPIIFSYVRKTMNKTMQRTSQTHHLHSTLDTLLSSSFSPSNSSLLSSARHLLSLSAPFLSDIHLANRLLSLFSKLRSINDLRKLFDCMPCRNICSYNTVISGYCKEGDMENAVELFGYMNERDHFSYSAVISGYTRWRMPVRGLEVYRKMFESERRFELWRCDNRYTASCALVASSSLGCVSYGKEIHSHVIRLGLESDMVFYSALVEMYGKCGRINYARNVFDIMPKKDVVSWSAMTSRYFDHGFFLEGFEVFSNMCKCNIKPNEFTFTGLLQACTELTLEETGQQIHSKMLKLGACGSSSLFSQSALIHMYSKCGSINDACKLFDEMLKHDLVSWTAIITGCAQNGLPQKAIKYYDLMTKFGLTPDHVTFIGVLTACAHAGLVEKGQEIFDSIKMVYNLDYISDHYACLVDLLSRSGKLEEAEGVIAKMPKEMVSNKFLWASLLNGSRIFKNVRIGKWAANKLFELEPENPASYVTLANIYSSFSLFDDVAKIREIMVQKGVVKKPGSSWITIDKNVHLFLANDKSHEKSKEIYDFLDRMYKRIKEELGYEPSTNFVIRDLLDEQKEDEILYHSERLAIALGIIMSPKLKPVKVFKNLRICGDCHNFMKFVSRVSEREIIVRDSNRFHHFKEGVCSCGDFW